MYCPPNEISMSMINTMLRLLRYRKECFFGNIGQRFPPMRERTVPVKIMVDSCMVCPDS